MRWIALLLVAISGSPQLRAQRATDAPRPQPRDGVAAPVVPEVLAAQVMLDRVGFSPGEIDGQPGSNLKRALAAFQASRGLTPTGAIDDATYERLQQDGGTQPPLVTYTITATDIAGPFTPDIPSD